MSRPPDPPTFFVDRDLGPNFFNRIAADGRFRVEIAAHAAKVLIVVGGRTMADHAANFLVTYPRIERFVRNRAGPYTAKVYHPAPADLKKLKPKGRIELWGDW